MRPLTLMNSLGALLIVCVVRVYQLAISPLLGSTCRFTPTCSEYMVQAVRKHGATRGAVMGVQRILRCHPWSRGGVDPP